MVIIVILEIVFDYLFIISGGVILKVPHISLGGPAGS